MAAFEFLRLRDPESNSRQITDYFSAVKTVCVQCGGRAHLDAVSVHQDVKRGVTNIVGGRATDCSRPLAEAVLFTENRAGQTAWILLWSGPMRGVLYSVLLVLNLIVGVGAQTPIQDRLLESLRRELTDKLQASGRFSSIAVSNKTTLKAKTLDGLDQSIALDSLAADVLQKPTQRTEIVERFVRMLSASAEPQKKPISRDDFVASLRLVIRPKDYLAQLAEQKSLSEPLWRPFAGSALVFVAFDRGERLEIALAGGGKEHDLGDDDIVTLSREQLKRFLPDIETEDAAGVRALTLPDAVYSPSLLLLEEPWAKVEKDFGAGFVVAIPDRNTLLAASARNAAQLRKAVELVAMSRKAAPMIPELLQRSGVRWVVFSGQ